MKKIIRTLSLFSALLMLSLLFNPTVGSAQAVITDGSDIVELNEEAIGALDKSVYIDIATRTAHVDRELALSYYDFTDEELNIVQGQLDNLTDEQITEIINYSLDNGESGVQLRSATAIIIVGITIIIGIIATTAFYFSSKYMTHKEKQNLIDRCYDAGGTPIIDSGDIGDIGGAPEKAWWKISNTYSFKCAI